MRIAAASIELASAHSRLEFQSREERLNAWNRRPTLPEAPPRERPASDISAAGRTAQTEESCSDCEPRFQIIRLILEALTGRAVQVFDAGQLASPGDAPNVSAPPPQSGTGQGPGFGLTYELRETRYQSEDVSFHAAGSVTTADGRSFDFQLSFALHRESLSETRLSLRLGEAARQKDPLVINFSGKAPQLALTRFSFDLDGDGTAENLAAPMAGSGFLAIDRNGNGIVDDGSELFGPASGDGFSELATLDGDGNGWIDENDAQFATLRTWNPLADPGRQGLSLAEAGVGALSLSRVTTPFDLYGSDAAQLGTLRATGIALRETGEAGTISHIDLTA